MSARPSSMTCAAILRSCGFQSPRSVEQQDDNLGIIDRPPRVRRREPLELIVDLGPFPKARSIDEPHRAAFPLPMQADRIARDPGFGAGNHPLLAEHSIDERGLARVRPSNDRELERVAGVDLVIGGVKPLMLHVRLKGLEQVREPFAMFGTDRDRVAKTKAIGFESARLRRRYLRPCCPRRPPASFPREASARFLRRATSRLPEHRSRTKRRRPPAPPPRSVGACGLAVCADPHPRSPRYR